jgi:hypothetical protein
MDLGSIFLGVALLLVVAFIVAQPLLAGDLRRERQPGPADQLRVEHERVLTQLRDLDFDHATGKLLDEDYTAQRAQLVAQGVEVLKQLDALTAAIAAAEPTAARAASVDDEIEAALAARKAGRSAPPPTTPPAAASVTCPHCGRAAAAGDQFCGKCGQRLPAPAGLSQAQAPH